MDKNIYRAPEADLEIVEETIDQPFATKGKRFLNMIIDFIGYMILALVIGVILELIGLVSLIEQINDYIFSYLIMLLYYFPVELIWGRSLGKLVTRTKVVSLDGSPLTFWQVLRRTLVRFVPFEAFSYLSGERPNGWHDKWSKTKVVSSK